jgi:hypothetical protein
MKFEKTMGWLLVLNLAMVVYLVFLIVREPPAPGSTAGRNTPGSPAPEPVRVTNYVEVPFTNAFHWSQLESENYRVYIENLQAIGCPVQTIRDIIIADLDLLWAHRIRSIHPGRETLRYWHSEEQERANNVDGRELARAELAVDREKRDVIRELIGVDLVAERTRLQGKEDKLERRLGFLPAEKIMDLRAVTDQFKDEEWALLEKQWAEGQPLSSEERVQLKTLREKRSAMLDQLLSPEERRQYELWMSPAADTVRHDFYGMNGTEGEFVKVYEIQKQFEEQWSDDLVDLQDPLALERRDQAKADLDRQVKEALGEERFADYERGRDEDFHLLNSAVSRYGLDRSKAGEVYEMSRTLEQVRASVLSNPGFTPDQKRDALNAIERETQAAMKEALGDNAYHYFRRHSGWLRDQR